MISQINPKRNENLPDRMDPLQREEVHELLKDVHVKLRDEEASCRIRREGQSQSFSSGDDTTTLWPLRYHTWPHNAELNQRRL